MKTEFDLRLAYKADTGVSPIHGDESSLRGDFDIDFSFCSNAPPANFAAVDVELEAQEAIRDIEVDVDGLLSYLYWLEERLLG